jgi:hypothetical protein
MALVKNQLAARGVTRGAAGLGAGLAGAPGGSARGTSGIPREPSCAAAGEARTNNSEAAAIAHQLRHAARGSVSWDGTASMKITMLGMATSRTAQFVHCPFDSGVVERGAPADDPTNDYVQSCIGAIGNDRLERAALACDQYGSMRPR